MLSVIYDLENKIAEIERLAMELTKRAKSLRKIFDKELEYYDLRKLP
jgi:hypothetical protein